MIGGSEAKAEGMRMMVGIKEDNRSGACQNLYLGD